ncbi:MAG: metallophosphoesterase family protein [Pseudomonadota bacterium]|nr:metallophosphoesterase family protein [Pseudomonadota bacterium]
MTDPRRCDQDDPELDARAISRREFLAGMSLTGLAGSVSPLAAVAEAAPAPADGTPEQVHLTWGADPSRSVCVSWATPSQARNPRVEFGLAAHPLRTVHAVQRSYTDGLDGTTVFTCHAALEHLEADSLFEYRVTADNDGHRDEPFRASFRTAPRGAAAFRWTSFGDLATPVASWVLSSPQSRFAVHAVERFAPLFHLLNGDLCYANLNPGSQPQVWRDFANNAQDSAAHRPWMPCPGNHEIEFCNGAQGLASYLTRYTLPDNGTPFAGCWYRFRVGSALFISLSADDVIHQDSGAFVPGPSPLEPAASTGNRAIEPGTSFYIHGYSGGAQTRWLEQVLIEAAADRHVDWIIVQMHQDALSSSKNGNGCDKGIREAWLPLFDKYGVDLVLCGHDHDYERSWPVHGCNHDVGRDVATGRPVDTLQPKPVITVEPHDGIYDMSQGTIHLILGGGGTSAPLDAYGVDPATGRAQAKVITKPNRPRPGAIAGTFTRPGADAVEEAIWSARRDASSGYGIGVFDLDPGSVGGRTTITIRYYHASDADRRPNPNYELFDTLVLAKGTRRPGTAG